jgi:hypothetical protein
VGLHVAQVAGLIQVEVGLQGLLFMPQTVQLIPELLLLTLQALQQTEHVILCLPLMVMRLSSAYALPLEQPFPGQQ